MLILAIFSWSAVAEPAAAGATTETIVLLRHGEKPDAGLGQLSCQGLNRAIALAAVISRKFGRPDAIFAPNPAVQKQDGGEFYDYVRPLATIEPAAIGFGLPVNASLGLRNVPALARALMSPALGRALVVVAWEHTEVVAVARMIMTESGGSGSEVPDWDRPDFDSMYVIRITHDGSRTSSRFERLAEGLDGLPTTCPNHR